MLSRSWGRRAWFNTEKFDLDAKPEGEGSPNDKQWKGMLQKLLVERLQLKFHRDKKELSVYVLAVGKDGPKLTKSEGDPNGLPGLFFRGRPGDLVVHNATMIDFTSLLQNAVLDRPVLDQTKIPGAGISISTGHRMTRSSPVCPQRFRRQPMAPLHRPHCIRPSRSRSA